MEMVGELQPEARRAEMEMVGELQPEARRADLEMVSRAERGRSRS
jgi:hypothetical protein